MAVDWVFVWKRAAGFTKSLCEDSEEMALFDVLESQSRGHGCRTKDPNQDHEAQAEGFGMETRGAPDFGAL